MEKIEITRDMMLAARDYVPEAEKQEFLRQCGDKCFSLVSVKVNGDAAPDMYVLDSSLRLRYLMGALAELYFGAMYRKEPAPDGAETPFLMESSEFDFWGAGHPLRQIERWKSDNSLRDKCFDLLSDYKELEKRFGAEIHGLLEIQNDVVVRQMLSAADAMRELPEALGTLRGLAEKKAAPDTPHTEG